MTLSKWPSWWNAAWDAWFRAERRWVVPHDPPPPPTPEMIVLMAGGGGKVVPGLPSTSVALTGTVTTAVPADIVAGGKTIIATIANDTLIASGASFDAQRQAAINGLLSAQSETHGWNNEVRAKIAVTDVVRTDDHTITVTLDAASAYSVIATETITWTIPASILVGGNAIIASPTFNVTVAAAGFFQNQPVGWTVILNEDCQVAPVHGVRTTNGGYVDDGAGGITAVSDPSNPCVSLNGGNNVLETQFTTSLPGGSAPCYMYKDLTSTAYKKLYQSVVMYQSSNFVNNGNSGCKRVWTAGDQVQGAFAYDGFANTNGNDTTLVYQDFQQGPILSPNYPSGTLPANTGESSDVLNLRGTYVEYEIIMGASTDNSTADGTLDVWINGTKTHHYTDLIWNMAAARHWLSHAWNPTYGGGTNHPPATLTERIAHIRLVGSNT